MITRRGLITGLVGLVAAPAIVRASSLMPIKPWVEKATAFPGYPADAYLNSPWGNIPVRFALDMPRDTVVWLPASEPIYRDDIVIFENGAVRRARPGDMTPSGVLGRSLGVAKSNTNGWSWAGGPLHTTQPPIPAGTRLLMPEGV